MKVDRHGISFSTGKVIPVYHGGVICLQVFDVNRHAPIVEVDCVHTGSDDGVLTRDLTPAEQLELADFMLCKWLEFKNKVGAQHEQNQDHG